MLRVIDLMRYGFGMKFFDELHIFGMVFFKMESFFSLLDQFLSENNIFLS